MTNWSNCTKILCIRPDNMGDLLMSGPAIRALKQSFNAHITVLTSNAAGGITPFMPEVDQTIIFDMPWVKTDNKAAAGTIDKLIAILQAEHFDAAVIFTVFSQSPLPSAMLAYQAGIKKVLAYSRENPYGLLTNWVPDEEPYTLIRHQVERDMLLVASIGANSAEENLHINVPLQLWPVVKAKAEKTGWHSNSSWLILHPGVSEPKRQYPIKHWISVGKKLTKKGYQLLITGTAGENMLAAEICSGIGPGSFNCAGLFRLDEFICLIKHSPLLVSVNTGPVHIAAAINTPVVVLYAQTNPQHTPWKVLNRVLQFPVQDELQSKNEVIRYLQKTIYKEPAQMPKPDTVVKEAEELLKLSVASDQQSH